MSSMSMTATSTRLAALQARMSAELTPRLAEHVLRLGWDDTRIAQYQRDRLRAVLANAVERSPFHARRLRGLDPDRFELEDLGGLPVMTKAQMTAELDDVLTDRRLSRHRIEEHLAASTEVASLLLEDYVCLASGGSSGVRGTFVQTLGEYAQFIASLTRRAFAAALAAGGPPTSGLTLAIVGAAAPIHSSGFGAAVAAGPPIRLIPAPATLPLPEMVARLNAAQPPGLLAYASKLAELAREQLAGRLQIAPRTVTSMAELLTDADRLLIERAFSVPVIDSFVSTEGLVGNSEPGGSVIAFATDNCLVELVDADNRPVAPGVSSAKVLVTDLHNLTQPLIRYELTDRLVIHTGTPPAGWLRASIDGRADDAFHYRDVAVHPHVLRSVMVGDGAVREFQAMQTERGVSIAFVGDAAVDRASLTVRVENALSDAGLVGADVRIEAVEAIPRDPRTGKVRRFIPR